MIPTHKPHEEAKPVSPLLTRLDRPLEWLFGIFLLCLFLVFGLRGYFSNLESEIKQLGANERARLFVGEEIVRSIQALEKDIYSMALTQNSTGFQRISQSVNTHLSKLKNDLDVLQVGGVSTRQMQLNLDSADQMVREARYTPPADGSAVVMELLEIAPQLNTIGLKKEALGLLLQRRWNTIENEDREGFYQVEEEIALLLKQIPPYFERLHENANRLFLEGDQRLKVLDNNLQSRTEHLQQIETGLISLVVILGGLSGILFMRRLTAALRSAEIAKQDAEQQRAQNDTMLNTLGDGVYATDMQGAITFINRVGEHILGWSAAELQGKPAHQAIHATYPDGTHFPQEKCPLIKVLDQGMAVDGEEHFVNRLGRHIPVSYRSSPLLKDGKIAGSLVSFHDISERIESEARIRLQQAALDAAANMIVITNRAGIIEYVNPAFCKITGYEPDEVVGEHSRKLSSGQHERGFYQQMWQALLEGRSWEGELTNRRKNGEIYSEQMTITPIIEGGEVAHFVAIKRDISEEIRTRTQLKLIEAAIQDTDQGIHIMDALPHEQGPIIQYINAGFCRISGYSRDEVLGQRAGFMRSPDADVAKFAQISQAMSEGASITLEMNYLRKDRTPFVGELHLSPVHSDNGIVSHYIGLLSDIELRKQAERALHEARDQALENSRLKSEFLSTMSHEIRTPMNGIIGMTDLLLDTQLDAEQRDFTSIVRDSAQALLVIINDILDFSKIEAGKLDIEVTALAIQPLVQGSIELLTARAQEKSLRLTSQLDPSLPHYLRGDPTRLRQVLLNLLSNAIKFTHQGQVELTVVRVAGTPEMVRFEVHDTGIGISPATQARLFQSFTQADSSTTRKYGGTGLGLAICKRLVELMGGTIGIHSQVNQGSTFWFTLPLEPVNTAEGALTAGDEVMDDAWEMLAPSPEMTESGTTTRHTPGDRGLILLAEDNLINQKVAQLQVTQMGYTLHIVNNGQEAVQAVEAAVARQVNMYAAVLMDCQMPVLDGFEATALIRKAEQDNARPHMPIIAMTANAMQGDREHCLSAGMDDYLSKPIRPGQLRQLLEQWVQTPSTPQAPLATRPPRPPEVPDGVKMGVLINFDYLNDIFGDDTETITRLLTLFKQTTDVLMNKLAMALQEQDTSGVCSLAHELKGSCGNMGLERMARLASELEARAEDRLWPQANVLQQHLSQAYADTLAASKNAR